MSHDFKFDWQRAHRTGVPEVVLAEHKSTEQLLAIASQSIEQQFPLFMTRVNAEKAHALQSTLAGYINYHSESCTVFVGQHPLGTMVGDQTGWDENIRAYRQPDNAPLRSNREVPVAVVAGGTSDVPVVAEIEQSLLYLGKRSDRYVDVGVAGLWRLTDIAEKLTQYRLIIAVAGMEGALFSVLAGLVQAPVIAVPVSVGYGVAQGGHAALHSALSSCAPGIAVVNVDNGFGAAALAVKILDA